MIKLLVLIIADDSNSLYIKLQELWKYQMDKIQMSYIDYYFLKCDPTLDEEIKIVGNTFYVKLEESIFYGITYKTLKAIEYFSQNYDYILRTNLSSFYRFDKLYDILKLAPRNNYYAGIHGGDFVSGCGFIISKDIASNITKNIDKVWDPNIRYDDVCFGKYIFTNFPTSFHHIPRYDFVNQPSDFVIPEEYPHFRIKYYYDRDKNDIYTRQKLMTYFL